MVQKTLGKTTIAMSDPEKNVCADVNCSRRTCQDGKELKVCTRCYRVWYCSGECQVKSWREHKTNCSIWKTEREARSEARTETRRRVQSGMRMRQRQRISNGKRDPQSLRNEVGERKTRHGKTGKGDDDGEVMREDMALEFK